MPKRDSTPKTKSHQQGDLEIHIESLKSTEGDREKVRKQKRAVSKWRERQRYHNEPRERRNEWEGLWVIWHLSHWSTGKTTRRFFYHLCPGPGPLGWGKNTKTTASSPLTFMLLKEPYFISALFFTTDFEYNTVHKLVYTVYEKNNLEKWEQHCERSYLHSVQCYAFRKCN